VYDTVCSWLRSGSFFLQPVLLMTRSIHLNLIFTASIKIGAESSCLIFTVKLLVTSIEPKTTSGSTGVRSDAKFAAAGMERGDDC
jgi:hypothetical protein